MPEDRLRLLLAEDPERGWRAFIDGYTPTLLALNRGAGVVDRDETMEVYVRACERLAANHYAALRRRDPSIGSLTGLRVAFALGNKFARRIKMRGTTDGEPWSLGSRHGGSARLERGTTALVAIDGRMVSAIDAP
jgi:hypothetical protein